MKRLALLAALAALLVPGKVAASTTSDPSLLVVPDDIVLVADSSSGSSAPFDFYVHGKSMLRCQLDGPNGAVFELSAPVEALSEFGDAYAMAEYGQRGVQLPFDNATTPQPAVYTATCYQHSIVSYDPHLGNPTYTTEATATGSFTITVNPPPSAGRCPSFSQLVWGQFAIGDTLHDWNGDRYVCRVAYQGQSYFFDNFLPN